MTKSTRYFMAGSGAVLAAGLCTGLVAYYGGGFPSVGAASLPQELVYVPADAAIVAYADVRGIMDSELRQRLKAVVPIPEKGQQEFFEKTGIDIEHDIDYVVAAVTPGGALGASLVTPGRDWDTSGLVVARGRFNDAKLESLAREHGAQVQEHRGKRLLVLEHFKGHEAQVPGASVNAAPTHNSGVLAFLEPGVVAIGNLPGIQRAIDAQMNGQSITSNAEMMDLVKDIERTNNSWAVGRFDLIANRAKLPEQVARQIPPIKWFAFASQINGGISGRVRVEALDDQSAENLRGIVNGVVSLARLQGQNDPKLSTLVQSLQMGGSGRTVELYFSVPTELLEMMAPKPVEKK
jgi:hypothetical protein